MGRSATLTAYMRNLHTIPLPQTAYYPTADGCFLKEMPFISKS